MSADAVKGKPLKPMIIHLFDRANNRGGATLVYRRDTGLLCFSICSKTDSYCKKTGVKTALSAHDEVIARIKDNCEVTKVPHNVRPLVKVIAYPDGFNSFFDFVLNGTQLMLGILGNTRNKAYSNNDEETDEFQIIMSSFKRFIAKAIWALKFSQLSDEEFTLKNISKKLNVHPSDFMFDPFELPIEELAEDMMKDENRATFNIRPQIKNNARKTRNIADPTTIEKYKKQRRLTKLIEARDKIKVDLGQIDEAISALQTSSPV